MQKEYAGTDLKEIRRFLMEDNEIRYTRILEDRGAEGFILSAPNGDWTEEEAARDGNFIHVTVWPRKEGGYWLEEY